MPNTTPFRNVGFRYRFSHLAEFGATMKWPISVVIGLIFCSCSQIQKLETTAFDPGRSTVKIQAISADGQQNLGSGVVIAPNKIATNCHVIRKAKRAYLSQPDRLYPVLALAALPELDVCILQTDHLDLPAADMAESETIKLGDDIVLSGYPFALSLRMMRGKVSGLHPYGDDHIIEINAGFNHGASGGGVFDSNGKLIGLMTFMGPEAGTMHFYVIPAAWLAMGLEQEFVPLKPFKDRSFWEKGGFVKQLKQ
jgi:serine protease Do